MINPRINSDNWLNITMLKFGKYRVLLLRKRFEIWWGEWREGYRKVAEGKYGMNERVITYYYSDHKIPKRVLKEFQINPGIIYDTDMQTMRRKTS